MTAAQTLAEVQHVYRTGRTRSVEWRLGQLSALQQLLEDHTDAIEIALQTDLGKNGFESWVAEIGQVLHEIKVLRKQVSSWAKPQRVRTPVALWPASSKIQHEPRGTVLVISPWNYPILLSLSPLAGAVAAGNAVVMKPSEIATAVETLLAELIPQYLDPHAVRVVTGGPNVVHQMLSTGPDYVFFTGSPRVGSIIAQTCAQHHIDYTLELGGQSPVYVHDDANIDTTATRLVWGKFFNAGQTCVAPNHIYVHQAVAEKFQAAVLAKLSEQFGPNPQNHPDYPRMITPDHTASLAELLAASTGTTLHGGTIDAEQRFIEPTIITDISEDDALMSRELFGPVLPIIQVTGIDDAVHRINQRAHPLAAYVFTESNAIKDTFCDHVVAGAIGINIAVLHVANPHLPFGGVGASGRGQYHGRWSLERFTHQRAVFDKPTNYDTIKFLAQPVPGWANRLVRRLLSAGKNPPADKRAAQYYRTRPPQ